MNESVGDNDLNRKVVSNAVPGYSNISGYSKIPKHVWNDITSRCDEFVFFRGTTQKNIRKKLGEIMLDLIEEDRGYFDIDLVMGLIRGSRMSGMIDSDESIYLYVPKKENAKLTLAFIFMNTRDDNVICGIVAPRFRG